MRHDELKKIKRLSKIIHNRNEDSYICKELFKKNNVRKPPASSIFSRNE